MNQASYYRERADKLIGEVKDMFGSMFAEDGKFISPTIDLLQRLLLVDNVERLGIDRHFINEIKTTLDYIYRYVVIVPLSEFMLFIWILTSKLYWTTVIGRKKALNVREKSGATDLNSTSFELFDYTDTLCLRYTIFIFSIAK